MENINEIIKEGDLDRLIRIKFKNKHEALKALKFSASQPHTSLFAYIFKLSIIEKSTSNVAVIHSLALESVKFNQLDNLRFVCKMFYKKHGRNKNKKLPLSSQMMRIAISNGNRDIVQYLHDNGYLITFDDIVHCIKCNQLKILRFMINCNKNEKYDIEKLLEISENEDITNYLVRSYQ